MRFDQTTELLTVGQLASQAGVRPDTIRYYDRAGLLPAPERTSLVTKSSRHSTGSFSSAEAVLPGTRCRMMRTAVYALGRLPARAAVLPGL